MIGAKAQTTYLYMQIYSWIDTRSETKTKKNLTKFAGSCGESYWLGQILEGLESASQGLRDFLGGRERVGRG